MSILLLAFPDWIAIMNMLSAMSPNVLLSPLVLFTKLIPSIMHADGNGIDLAGAMLLSICHTRVDFFAFLRVPSNLDNGQGNGPKGCFKRPSFLVSRLRLVATNIIFPNNLLSAFRITSIPETSVFLNI